MSEWLWVLVLVPAVWLAHWGAERLAKPLKKARRRWGLTQVAGAAFVGLAAASPEVGINTTSAVRGVGDIGLGASLGSNVLAIPLIITVAYWASRKAQLGGGKEQGESSREHRRHREQGLLRMEREAVWVQALPYLALVGLFALVVLPSGWRGLQPVDGWILLAAYLVYLGQAVLRGRKQGEDEQWTKKEIAKAVAGVAALAVGAYFTVRSTENIVSAIGISRVVGGMFITAPMAALPEVFAVWSVTRSGQVTAATTSVMGDHAVTMTIAFLPLAFIGLPVTNLTLLTVNLAFVALMPLAYSLLVHFGSPEHGFKRWQVLALDALYVLFVLVVVFSVLPLRGGEGRIGWRPVAAYRAESRLADANPPTNWKSSGYPRQSPEEWQTDDRVQRLENRPLWIR